MRQPSSRSFSSSGVSLLHVSDTHLSATGDAVEGQDPDRRLAALCERVTRAKVSFDAVVISGDLTHDGSLEACVRLRSALEPLGGRLLAVAGNHDDVRCVSEIFPNRSLEVRGWRILGVDTSQPERSAGRVDVPALMRQLDALDRRRTLLAMHHPPQSPATHPAFRLAGARDLAAALQRRPHVKGILSGHIHAAFSEPLPCGAVVLGAPSVLIGFVHRSDGSFVRDSRGTGAQHIVMERGAGLLAHQLVV